YFFSLHSSAHPQLYPLSLHDALPILHTGHPYDSSMSDAFFEELWIPAPDYHLGVGPGSQAEQTAAVMQRLEPVFAEVRPDLVHQDRKSTRLNSSHVAISYAVFCLKKK